MRIILSISGRSKPDKRMDRMDKARMFRFVLRFGTADDIAFLDAIDNPATMDIVVLKKIFKATKANSPAFCQP
jgi:hypothetical protein